MKINLILAVAILMLVAQGKTQDLKKKSAEMSKLDFMVGTWEGSGWYRTPDGKIRNFTQKEDVDSKLDGLVLVVEGKGYLENGNNIHNAFAMITYDEQSQKYSFNSHLADGKSIEADGWFNGEDFEWGFELPQGGSILYSINYENDTWTESGKYSPDGNQWYPFIEMTLKRK